MAKRKYQPIYMRAQLLAEVLFYAAKAKTEEERVKVAWRASDYMWREAARYLIGMARQFNDWCQDQDYPVVTLYDDEERFKLFNAPQRNA
jgi:hypothetical protein